MIEIFEATYFDINSIAAMFNEYRIFYKQNDDLKACGKFIADRITRKDSVIYIAATDEIAAGFVQLYPVFSSVKLKSMWVLNDLFVKKEFRRTGVAKKLIEASKKHSLHNNSSGLMLETSQTNKEANALYLTQGFKVLENNFYSFDM
jgi:ribosomal protein S18 acetylase RimI-like enzyme